jgi:protein arginine N-methyltransferase 1
MHPNYYNNNNKYYNKYNNNYNNYNNYNKKYSNNYGNYRKKRKFIDFNIDTQNFQSIYPTNNIEKVTKSTEEGFTGSKENWFDNNEFFKNLPGHSDIENKKDYYFNSYSSFNIHEEMLKDKIRTGTFKDAIMENTDIFKDKIVLDIGCGTGILSIFAAKAGASHVYAIEFADIADYAKEIIKRNNLNDKITIIKKKVEDTELPVEKVDIIISEWMGYFLLYESMFDSVLYARDKWLDKNNGFMLPDTASITIASIEDVDYKKSKVDFWDNVYGINMDCFKQTTIAEPLIDICPKERINSNCCKIFEVDLLNVKKEDLDFSSSYELTFNRNNDYFSGIVGWFETGFTKLDKKFNLSTSPYLKSTHWQQTVFYTKKDFAVSKGDKVFGSIAVRKSVTNFRQLDIKISYHVDNGNKDNEENNWYQLYKIV